LHAPGKYTMTDDELLHRDLYDDRVKLSNRCVGYC